MRVRRLFVAVICISSLALPIAALAQKQGEKSCTVEFSEPRQGGTVSGQGTAKGTATVPPGKHLWIFAHIQGLALWWPQCGGPARIEKDRWVCQVTYGQNRDSGSDFEVAAAVLDDKDNTDMRNVIKGYEQKGAYPGVELPPPTEGCAISRVIVTRK
jgi:hypothetical protein